MRFPRARRPSPDASQSGERETRPLLCARRPSDGFCNDDYIGARARPRAPGPRLRWACGRCRPSPRVSFASRALLSSRAACVAPLLPERDGQRATLHRLRRLPIGYESVGGGTKPATAPRDAACEAAPRFRRRLRRGRVRRWRCACVSRPARSEGTPSLARTCRGRDRLVPLLRSGRAPHGRRRGVWVGRLDHPPHVDRPRSPFRRPPRRGASSRQSGCFFTFREPGAWRALFGLPTRCSPAVGPSSRGPFLFGR